MFEYKVEVVKVSNAEATMNRLAGDGWQVVATTSPGFNAFTVDGSSLIITFCRSVSL